MIALAVNCLLVQRANGESVPVSAETVLEEIMAEIALGFEGEFVKQAASAVFYYFRVELARQQVPSEEFKAALEKVLKGFAERARIQRLQGLPAVHESDLLQLAADSGAGCELVFFPRLREQFRRVSKMARIPRTMRFRGLKSCVKRLTGAKRWSNRCKRLEEQILDYLRSCLRMETRNLDVALVVF